MNRIIIFIKNPVYGKVKSRLAATVGHGQALEIYEFLLSHTQDITFELENVSKHVFYSHFIEFEDDWENEEYHKHLQAQTPDLGVRMAEAFREISALENTKKVIIIGCDCLQLASETLEVSYRVLEDDDILIGPTFDGGYYLLGFNLEKIGDRFSEVIQKLLIGKTWNNGSVYRTTVQNILDMNIRYSNLQILKDIDNEADWNYYKYHY